MTPPESINWGELPTIRFAGNHWNRHWDQYTKQLFCDERDVWRQIFKGAQVDINEVMGEDAQMLWDQSVIVGIARAACMRAAGIDPDIARMQLGYLN